MLCAIRLLISSRLYSPRNLVEGELLGALVALDNCVGLVGRNEILLGQQVLAGLVARRSDGLPDLEVQALGTTCDAEEARRLLALAVLDVGQGAVSVGSDQSLALDGCGFHGSGLENSK